MAGALDGIRVVEVAQWIAAPSGGSMLADWGAEVIKVEHPVRGDGLRGWNASPGGSQIWPASAVNYSFELDNRNKMGIAVDLDQPKGQQIVHRLIATGDVFLSNLRPYELEKFCLGQSTVREINPRIVIANLTGYGKRGPDANLAGFDANAYWARSGIMQMLCPPGGVPPATRPGFGDHSSAVSLACAIVLALLVRERTGVAQDVDVSLFHCGMWGLGMDVQSLLATGSAGHQPSREDILNPLRGYYRTKDDRWVVLSMVQPDAYWAQFCRALERPDLEHDPRFEHIKVRTANHRELIAILDEVFVQRTLAEWSPILTAEDLIWAPLQTLAEAIEDEQALANDHFQVLEHPRHGPIRLLANPIHLSKTPGQMLRAAPELGQHTEEVLLDIGYAWDDILELKSAGVII